ncbi:uncharacterized protein [Procambarus clarkii]|uniref:uncharacterized protein n=1 Tax=Procambarus clarkii TaxID=6728 RepID=UPI003742D765
MDSLVRRGRHLLFDVGISLRNLIAKDYSLTGRCDFYTSRETYLAFSSSLISQRNNPIVPAVKYRMLALVEFGIFERWFKTSVPNSTVCLRPPLKYAVQNSLNLTNLWGMFVVLTGGMAASLVALVTEVLTSRGLHCYTTHYPRL